MGANQEAGKANTGNTSMESKGTEGKNTESQNMEKRNTTGGLHWYTIDEFENRKPRNLYHKEQEETDVPPETVKNLHVLARAHVNVGRDGFCREKNADIHKAGFCGEREDAGIGGTGSCGEQERYRYVLRISADDYYKLYVDGAYVAQGPAPAYPEHYYYNEIDLTDYLTGSGAGHPAGGEHVIGVHLYYQGAVNRVWNSGDGRFGIGAVLLKRQIPESTVSETGSPDAKTPEAGSSETGAPDAGVFRDGLPQELKWYYCRCGAYSGEAIGYETQYLENFDSNLWEEDWNQAGYDDSGWKVMKPARWADYGLSCQPTKLLSCFIRPPKKVTKTKDGFLIDAGEEVTGALRLCAEGEKNKQVIIRCGEELEEDGTVRYEMRCNCTYEERWTLNGKTCRNEPYDYKGFRYAQLILQPGVKIRDIKLEVRHYPMEESCCTLTSSEPVLDQIFSVCKNGVKYGTQEGYIDCPTREKGQYLGDAVVTSHGQVWLSGSAEMMEKCIEQFAQSKRICPGLMGVAPGNFMQEIGDFSLLWSQMVLNHYRFTGDRQFLSRMYPIAKGVLEHFSRYEGEDGLLFQVADKWNLVDWPENLRDDYDFVLSRPVVAPGCHNVINALYTGAWKALAKMEEILGMEQNRRWEGLNEAYLKAFLRPEQGLLADSTASEHCAVHSNLYALYFELVPDEKTRKTIAEFLLRKGLCCGVFTSYFLLHGLANAGYWEEAYGLLLNDSEHGWVNMVREGATTCFEAWGKEQKWNTSLCHPWACAPISFFIERIAGIRPDPESKKGFSFEPHVPERLKEFELRFSVKEIPYVVRKKNGAVKWEIREGHI